jgi:hypothetical protein
MKLLGNFTYTSIFVLLVAFGFRVISYTTYPHSCLNANEALSVFVYSKSNGQPLYREWYD